jgi:hypothetical protein
MTTESAYPDNDPRRLLSSTRELAQRVRRAQRATWFPLLVLAAVTFASIPVYRYGGHHLQACVAVPGVPGGHGRVCTVYSNAQFVYWPIALVLAYVAIAAFYIRRSRARGIETRVRLYAIAGIIIAVALTGAALLEAHSPSASGVSLWGPSGYGRRLATPGAAIGLALLVLARAERSRALLLLTVGYLVVVLLPVGYVRVTSLGSLLGYLPLVIHGSVLLLGGIGFAVAQRPSRQPAP